MKIGMNYRSCATRENIKNTKNHFSTRYFGNLEEPVGFKPGTVCSLPTN